VLLLGRPFFDLWRVGRAGAISLDLGGSAGRWFYWLFAGLVAAGGIGSFFFGRGTVLHVPVVFFALGVGVVVWRTERFQLREAGIWCAGRLIPWDKIEGYEISASPALHLKIQGKAMKYFCDVPPALRQQAEELLASKCPMHKPKA
jgi:hypothetical protein